MKASICLALFQVVSLGLFAQQFKPGLPGMAPTKWISYRNVHAPGRVYQGVSGNSSRYTLEECYVKAYIPVAIKSRFALAVAPYYRSENFEIKGTGAYAGEQLSTWNLRSVGLDIKSLICLDSAFWMINTANISKSGNVTGTSLANVPLTYTISSVFMKRRSPDTEMGIGIMVNKSNNFLVLPVFVYNHNFSTRTGVEITLPHKVAWRYNLSSSDIFYIKSEANTRSYFLPQLTSDDHDVFRRIDVDMGIAYNRSFTSFMGAELFAGYRKNLSTRLPGTVIAVQNSGCFVTFDLYLKVPERLRLNKRK
ncbi:MAG TPA: DUF6268 family outer membrane beta-barrel protein [Chryseolinea sp.]|nr:DUF6268 family outer membrane beta-barrel protein [Chryseolinea sp.]